MPGSDYRMVYRLILFLTILIFSSCKSDRIVPAELSEIGCFQDNVHTHNDHAWVNFGKANVFFTCLDQFRARNPELVTCDIESGKPYQCDKVGRIWFSRSPKGYVYGIPRDSMGFDLVQKSEPELETEKATGYSSAMELLVIESPPFQPGESKSVDTYPKHLKFTLKETEGLLPIAFKYLKDAECESIAIHAVNRGRCVLSARTASLYWSITIAIGRQGGEEITAEDYIAEFYFWMPYLDKLVFDPA